MKKLKALCVTLAMIMAVIPAAHAYAADLTFTGEITTTAPEPTPVGETASVKASDENLQGTLCSEISDYDGRIKKASYVINGEEWTVVEKIGASFVNEELPEGFSEYEVVYQETFEPAFQTAATYTSTTLVNTREYYRNDDLVATVHESYVVWYYTSGLVHLYSCSFSKSTASGYDSSYIVNGSIVNRDGSASYTSGYKFVVRGTVYSATYDLNFIVTHSFYDFY